MQLIWNLFLSCIEITGAGNWVVWEFSVAMVGISLCTPIERRVKPAKKIATNITEIVALQKKKDFVPDNIFF